MSKTRKGRFGSVLISAALLSASTGAMAADTSGIEKRMKMLEQELQSLRSELAAVKASEPAQSQKVQAIEGRVSAVETATKEPVKQLDERVTKIEKEGSPYLKKNPPAILGNTIFFRGGYASLLDNRAFGSFTDTHNISGNLAGVLGTSSAPNDSDNGWFVGAGFDFLLTRDVWGMLPGTWALAELGVEYKNFGSKRTTTVVPFAECLAVNGLVGGGIPGAGTCAKSAVGDVELTMLTVSASPKVKFMEGSKLRPWIIPVGLDINVISPPSDSATVLDVGAQFAAGVDYEIIPGIKIGIDGRYHLTGDFTASNDKLTTAQRAAFKANGLTIDTDQGNDFWSVGGSLGIGF